ncbi:MAG: hypothetical protein EAZ57_09220 [Cytophagales bacterium]|nr:MAG: hypothetical protein EAZ67_10025 [Cytophagales bacterium]TAF59947.1 MAG: hypothetical protein EAZ57_09220 [Cytophagales bacterium]
MYLRASILLLILLLGSNVMGIFAQDTLSTIYIPGIEDLINKKEEEDQLLVTLATGSEISLEEAPSIISVVTQKDIQHYGCRDLADVLRLVPGFEFGVDVLALYGLGFRGVWAHEGKALITINGQSINCFGYGNFNFFGTVPATMIERVEIIRGPGGALYGGFAEVAVINVVTKKIQGAFVDTYAGLQGTDPLYGGNISVGFSNDNDKEIYVNVGQQNSPISTRTYTDYYGTSFEMGTLTSYKRWQHINIRSKFKGFELFYNRLEMYHGALDYYTAIPTVGNGAYIDNELFNFNENYRAQYNIPLSSKASLVPSFEYARGNAISTATSTRFHLDSATGQLTSFDPSGFFQNSGSRSTKIQPQLDFKYVIPQGDVLVGIGGQLNNVQGRSVLGEAGLQFGPNPQDTSASVTRYARYAFFQVNKKIGLIGFTIGLRSESTPFGNALAPRLGFTFYKKGWNAKFLYGYAYRVPLLWQAYSRQFSASSMTPETSNTLEFEVGKRFSKNFFARANTFFINIDRPITYIGLNNSYQNFGRVQSLGVEAELNARFDKGGGFLNLSYSRPGSRTSIDFMAEGQDKFLALPGTKINVGGYAAISKRLTVSSNLAIIGPREAQSKNSALNSTVDETIFETTTYKALYLLTVTANIEFVKKRLFCKIACNNLLNAPYVALQPYYGGHAPLPADDRFVGMSLSYRFY